jgi:uncharacterized membrane protein
VSTGRLETFCDGVFAIAITLLVLEIEIPHVSEGGLAPALAEQWPSYAAYVVSFAVIGIIWVNHHGVMTVVATVDRPLLFLNLLLLLFVALVPWPTALLAEYIRAPGTDSHVAAAVYSGTSVGIAGSFNLMWRYIVRDDRLIHDHLDLQALRRNTRRFSVGLVIYPITVGTAFISAPLTLGLHGLVAAFYVVDQATRGDVTAGS